MHTISQARKAISIVLKLIVTVCAAAGTVMSAYAGRNSFMGGSKVFMYFTIQSNIAIALISLIGCALLMRDQAIGNGWLIVKLAGTVSITLTGAVFAALLAPILGERAWSVPNTLTHLIVPLTAVADFFVVVSGAEIKRKSVIYVIILPLLYAVYAGIGYVKGWEFAKGQTYPYFFLNWGSPAGAFGFTDKLPYMGCVWWMVALLLFLITIGWCYLAIADKLGKNRQKNVCPAEEYKDERKGC